MQPPAVPIASLSTETEAPAPATVAGRIVGAGPQGVLLQDYTGVVEIRPVPSDVPPLGAWVQAHGVFDGERVTGAQLRVVSEPSATFPTADGDWGWYEGAPHRARNLLARARILREIRRFFEVRHFVEVETPLMVPSPGLDLHLDAFEIDADVRHRFLITSPEYQMKRLLAGGLPRIYQVCRCFRRNEQGAFHEPEFTMLEWYRAMSDGEAIMADTEQLVARVAAQTRGSLAIQRNGQTVDLTPPWERMTVERAFERYAGVAVGDLLGDEERFFRVLVECVEPQLGRNRPTFLTYWPAQMASLARLSAGDPAVAERFEAYVGGIELCNGFSELIDAEEQRDRLTADQRARSAIGKPVYPIDERFIEALEEGLSPSGGNALGVDRLVMLLLEADHIEDVVAIPSSRL